jgi:NhaA family Na+:H+ antiporter
MGWLAGAAALGGIGFTMSVFIANLAFDEEEFVVASKISVLIASIVAALLGLLLLRWKAMAKKIPATQA